MTARRLEHICVVGAGLAGLSCALAAARNGRPVTLLEAAPQDPRLAGGVDVMPNMLRDLAALELGDDCVRSGFAYTGLDVVNRHGVRLHQWPTRGLAGARYPAALGMPRADLLALLELAARRAGAQVLRGQQVVAVKSSGRSAQVHTASGQSWSADLVLLAVGATSTLRAEVFDQAQAVPRLAQRWGYVLLRRPPDLDRPCIVIGDAGHRQSLLPVRHDLVSLAWVEPVHGHSTLESPLQLLRATLARSAPQLQAFMPQLGEHTQVVQRPVYSGLLEPIWHQGAVLAVGDCAHALPPHFGQSAAQAIEDARVLNDLLRGDPDAESLSQSFTARRLTRVRQIHELTDTAASWDLHPRGENDLSVLLERLWHTVAQPA
jgi:2-polyprenyl-6-methoxyphenol hydroxylase-like FAD-dependent oxidoreductase